MRSDASSSQWNAPDGLRSRLHEAGDSRAPALSFARAPTSVAPVRYPGRDHALPTLLFEEFSLMQGGGPLPQPTGGPPPVLAPRCPVPLHRSEPARAGGRPHRVRATPAFGLLLNGPGLVKAPIWVGCQTRAFASGAGWQKLLEMALPIAPRHYQVTGFSVAASMTAFAARPLPRSRSPNGSGIGR